MFNRIDHVELVPGDFERSLHFYSDILGFKIQSRRRVDRPPLAELVFIELGGTVIEMFSVQNPAPASTEQWQIGWRKIAIAVEDVARVLEYLKTQGVAIPRGLAVTETLRRVEIKDPDGLTIELIQRE